MIDSHCHLNFPAFDQDRGAIIDNCLAKGISQFLVPATESLSFTDIVNLSAQYPSIYFALGLHPYFLTSNVSVELDALAQEVDIQIGMQNQKLLAIGETGLDYVVGVSREKQIDTFIRHLDIAESVNLPVILHHRKSHNDIIRIVKEKAYQNGGVIHAFSGSEQQAREYVELGFKLGIGGGITYPRANKTKLAIKAIGIEHLLLETDSPDMPMHGRQGQRNSPEYLSDVVSVLCEMFQLTKLEVEQKTNQNFWKVFRQPELNK